MGNDIDDISFTAGIDEACRQVNEMLEARGDARRFINAGLNTVCETTVDSPSFTEWLKWERSQHARY